MYSPVDTGTRLRMLRERLGKSQKEIAAVIGLSQSSVAQHESGRTELTPKTLILYSTNYHVSTDYILCLTDDPLYGHKVGGTIYFATEKKPPDLSDGEPPVYTEGTVTLDQDAPLATRREIEQIVRDQLRELLSGPSKNES